MKRHFFIEGRYLGSNPQVLSQMGTDPVPRSMAFCCPRCGDVWARFPMEPAQDYTFYRSGCRKHPWPRSEPAGSVWWLVDGPTSAAFPGAMLQWELERHLDWKEKQ